jgi:uncharacterized protein YbjT (DUF2867 family)
MRIAVLGASRGTGAQCVRAALERGHTVTAFSRNPDTLQLESSVDQVRLTKLAGDIHQPRSVDAAVRGQDAVIVTASAPSLKAFRENPNFFTEGTGYAIDAMRAHGVRRLVVLSALGTGESRRLMNFLVKKLVLSLLLKAPFEDHERQERLVRESGLDWVIARPARLTDGPGRKKYVKKTAIEPVPGSIARADVADFLVTACEVGTWVNHAVQIGG